VTNEWPTNIRHRKNILEQEKKIVISLVRMLACQFSYCHGDISIDREIGRGNFGEVSVGRIGHRKVAIKSIKKHHIHSDFPGICREVVILR